MTRQHEDIDLSVFRRDLPVAAHLPRAALPPVGRRRRRGCSTSPRARDARQRRAGLGARARPRTRGACEFLLNRDVDGRWQSKRDTLFQRTAATSVTWERDGVRYLAPELRADATRWRAERPKDDDDLTAALPLLDPAAARSPGRLRARPTHPSTPGGPGSRRRDLRRPWRVVGDGPPLRPRRGGRCRRRRPGSSGCARGPSGSRRGRPRTHSTPPHSRSVGAETEVAPAASAAAYNASTSLGVGRRCGPSDTGGAEGRARRRRTRSASGVDVPQGEEHAGRALDEGDLAGQVQDGAEAEPVDVEGAGALDVADAEGDRR